MAKQPALGQARRGSPTAGSCADVTVTSYGDDGGGPPLADATSALESFGNVTDKHRCISARQRFRSTAIAEGIGYSPSAMRQAQL